MFHPKRPPRPLPRTSRRSAAAGAGAEPALRGPLRSFTSFMSLRSLAPVRSLAVLALGSLAACAPVPQSFSETPEVEETLANLVAAGFPESELRVQGGVVYAGGDAEVSLTASREMLGVAPSASPESTHEQYRTTNVVSEAVSDICLDGSLLPGLLGAALDEAIGNYNALALRKRLRRIAGNTDSCHAVIYVSRVAGNVARSGFPSGGLPFPSIVLGEALQGFGLDVLEQIVTHEIGHTLGLRHSDFYDRSISCGGDPASDVESGVGAVHIVGTPTTAAPGQSVMNACYDGTESGEFSRSDVVALNALYGFAHAAYGSQWSGFFSDAAGWASSESYWGTLAYPDVNGDGRADVCARSASGIICAVSVGDRFSPAALWTPAFGDAANWNLDQKYWGTVRFPDVNGDGRADVCGRSASGVQCALSGGQSFGPLTLWTSGYSDAAGWGGGKFYWGTIQYPDVNGDGRADVCGRGGPGLLCALSTGASFAPLSLWTAGYGDAGGWAGLEAYWGTLRFADLNGDGRDDVCGRGGPGILCALSIGSSFAPLSVWTGGFSDAGGWVASEAYWRTIRFPDVNGDGRADVCGRSSGGIACAQSIGAGFTAVSTYSAGFGDGWASSPAYYRSIDFPDLEGDGKADVCGRNATGIFCASSTGASFGLVAAVTRSFGDAAGWLAAPSLWRTVRFPDIDGHGGAEVCSRAPDGVTCAR